MLVYTYLNFNIFLNLYILETHSNKYICQIKKNTHTSNRRFSDLCEKVGMV